MYNVVLNEVMKELKFRERIILKLFSKTFIKGYNILRVNIINSFLK